MVTNYFKVASRGAGPVIDVFPFDETSESSIRNAWQSAVFVRDETHLMDRKIVAWRKIEAPGPWSSSPVTFLSGLQREFAREYL